MCNSGRSRVQQAENDQGVNPTEALIDIQSLRKEYPGLALPAVRDVSLSIQEGEIFGLLGPNGAGKTTTLSILSGLKNPTSGHLAISGYGYSGDRQVIQRLIGVVPQEIALFPKLTAWENLRFFGNMFGLTGAVLKARAFELLDQFGLAEFRDKQIGTFSGGMKRRVNLIAGILHHPRILFLDEPTVGVDVQSRNMILNLLRGLNQQGMTILYTSHHMEEAADLCTRIAIIDHGTIIITGHPADLIRQHQVPNLEHLFLNLTGRNLRDEC